MSRSAGTNTAQGHLLPCFCTDVNNKHCTSVSRLVGSDSHVWCLIPMTNIYIYIISFLSEYKFSVQTSSQIHLTHSWICFGTFATFWVKSIKNSRTSILGGWSCFRAFLSTLLSATALLYGTVNSHDVWSHVQKTADRCSYTTALNILTTFYIFSFVYFLLVFIFCSSLYL